MPSFVPLGNKQLANSLRDLARTLRLVGAGCGYWTLLWVVLLVLQGMLPVATVQLTRTFVDGLAAAIGSGATSTTMVPVLVPAALIAGVLLVTELLQLCTEWTRTIQSELLQDHIARLVHDKSVSMDIGFFEKSEFYDHLHRARADATARPIAILESSGSALQNGITLIAMAAVLLPYGLWLPPALLISTLPAFYVVVRASRRYHLWWNDSTVTRRRIQYFDMLLTEPFSAGEVRLFGLGGHFQVAYQTLRTRFRKERLTLLTQQYRSRLAAELVALAISGAAMLWMLYRALLGALTLGDLALFYQAFQRGQGLVRTLLQNIGQIYTNTLYVSNVFEFLQLAPQVVDRPDAIPAPDHVSSGIRINNVSFRYPGANADSLTSFSAFIPAGKIVALVGENGAGKTTLLKLLARFYDPYSGNIEVDGVELRRFSLHSLRKMLTFMFQVPIQYHLTARENISLGNLAAADDEGLIREAATSAGADQVIRRLPKGYDNLLGRWFPGGTELSGGEWQRLALARAFLRPAQIMLLDEPTSALDSWAEADWYRRLKHLANGRTVLLATHRLTIAARADLILMMKGGQIVESGNHEELLALGGLYCQSWTATVHAAPRSGEIEGPVFREPFSTIGS